MGLLPYALFPRLYGISAITNCAFGMLYLLKFWKLSQYNSHFNLFSCSIFKTPQNRF
jgi:hypothetical protein